MGDTMSGAIQTWSPWSWSSWSPVLLFYMYYILYFFDTFAYSSMMCRTVIAAYYFLYLTDQMSN